MPSENVTYHWAMAPSSIINPHTFTLTNVDINLPARHTLRRFLVNQPLLFWKRGSVSSDDQQMYFLHYEVQYGNTELAPIVYRTIRQIPHSYIVNAAGITEPYLGFHSGAALELGVNERLSWGGFDSPVTRLRLSWFISSSGAGEEVLAGQANMPFRALYSLPVLP